MLYFFLLEMDDSLSPHAHVPEERAFWHAAQEGRVLVGVATSLPIVESALRVAICNDHVRCVSQLLSEMPVLLNSFLNGGCTPLTCAAHAGSVGAAALLLEAKADINRRDNHAATALGRAAFKGNVGVVQILLGAKASTDVVASGLFWISALHAAAFRGCVDSVQALLRAGANVNMVDDCAINASTPLHLAARNGRTAVVQMLVNVNADVTWFDRNGFSALTHAAWAGHIATAAILVAAKAPVDGPRGGPQVLHWAVTGKRTHFLASLIRAKADVNLTVENKTPVRKAIETGCTRVMRLLLKAKAQINFLDVRVAAATKSVAIVQLLRAVQP